MDQTGDGMVKLVKPSPKEKLIIEPKSDLTDELTTG